MPLSAASATFALLYSAQLYATDATILQVVNAGSDEPPGLGRSGVKRVNGPERGMALRVPKVRRSYNPLPDLPLLVAFSFHVEQAFRSA